jgi:ubiquinone/menaquinone biosynthesis C-methylase UbiE
LVEAAGDNGVIVDVGCGSGEELRLLALEVQSGVELIGVDPSAHFAEATRKACSNCKVDDCCAFFKKKFILCGQ